MANIQSPEFWVLVLPIRVGSESSLGAHATLLVLSWGGSNVLYQPFFYLFLKVLFHEWSFAPGFCPFYGTWWGILSKLYFVYLLSTFLINFAHLDLNQSFLRNWHSTDTFFLAMCWGGGVRTGTFLGHTQLDYKLNISDKFKKIRPVVSEEMRQRDCYSVE